MRIGEIIREIIRRWITLSLLIVVLGSLGTYSLLRGVSRTSTAASKAVTASGPTPTPAFAETSQLPATKTPIPRHSIAKSNERRSPAIAKQHGAKPVPTAASISTTDSHLHTVARSSNHARPGGASLSPGPIDPAILPKAHPSKLGPAPLPQGGSGSPPNPPTANSPADGATGVSTSPTLKVNVSDPSSSNVTVNFYGKLVPSTPAGSTFSIIALPDTQYYSSNQSNGTLAMFNSQTQWIVNNRVADNIAFVIGLGDIVEDGNNNGDFSEWINASSAVSLLDNPTTTGLPQGIPYSFGVGNHDQGPTGNGAPDDTAGYNQYFGTSRYSSKSYYGGHFGTDNDNHYELFSAGGMDFIVINIAYMDPGSNGTELNNVLAWANNLLQTNSNRRGIVVSHYLINDGFNASWSDQGQVTYNALSGNPNLFLMLAGHWTPPEGQRADVNNGNRIFTFLSDYQEDGFGGDGWLRILTFVPSSNQIQVQTFSPFINQSETSSSGKFTVNYDMHGNGNNFTLLASQPGILSGGTASFIWPSLAAGSMYEWYVTVSNSTGTAVSPLWSFTTTGSSHVNLSPTSLTFPSQQVNSTSASQDVTLSNTGSTALSIASIVASTQFGQTSNCPISPATLALNASCTINVTFTPTASGTQSGRITITDNASGSPQQVNLTGTGTTATAPAVGLSAGSLTFGTPAVMVVQDAATTGSGANTLTAAFGSKVTKKNLMAVGVSSYAGNSFASPPITDTLSSLWTLAVARNPGTSGTPAQANLYYAFVPSTGNDTVTVHMKGTNSLHLHIYEVSGVVTSSALDKTGSNFQSSATVGTVSTTAATTSANEYVFALFARQNGSGAWTTGAGYGDPRSSPNSASGTDAISEDKIVATTGTQTARATASATDAITSVIATFVAPGGGTTVGTTSAAQTVTLTNTGNAGLTITSIAVSGDFSETTTCGSSLAAESSCNISVKFTPTATGTRTGAVTISDDAAGSPHIVSLTGIGK